MTAVSRMATPGLFYQKLEQDILQNKEKVTALSKERRCKVIQSVVLSALFIIAAVAAFVLASVYAPTYAPIVLFVGSYLLIGQMTHCVKIHFKDKWTQLDREIEQIQAIAKKHINISKDDVYQKRLADTFRPANDDELKKYTYLAAHYEHWQEVADNALNEHTEKHAEARQVQDDPTKKSEKFFKKSIKLAIRAQQLREEALHAKVQAAFVRAIMKRPDCTVQQPLFHTHYAPIPLQETDDDLTVNVSLFESNWAQNLLNRDLPPYENWFFESARKMGRPFLRTEVLEQDKFEAIVDEIVATMDSLVSQTLNQSGSGDGAQQLERLAQNA
jgi:hypothetical protein